MRGRLLVVLGLVALHVVGALPAFATDTVRVYLFAGQSNMVGYSARVDELPKIAPRLADRPANAAVYPQQAARTERCNAPESSLQGAFGPELSAMHRLAALHAKSGIAIVKCARSGTSLHTDWNPARPASLYHALLDATRSAAKSVADEPGTRVEIAGLFWMQGESDTDTRAHATAYRTNLTALIARLRTDLGVPDLPVVIGRIRDLTEVSEHRPFSGIVRAAQAAVAGADERAFVVSTDGLEVAPSSPIHFSTRGTIALGELFARQLAGLR